VPEFRPDVEGLRAVAISLVVLSHAGVGAAAGGFVGVDVFFVISGFLITRVLLGELDRTGRISLTRFYARRIKRLMPQALTAIAAVAVAAAVLLPPARAGALPGDMLAAGAYAMNWHLAAESTDYFAAAQDGPLDHFWSLAVEEQFYLLWPLILLLAVRGRGAVLALVAVASLAYAAHLAAAAPEAAYFSAPARAWELALGALLAVRPLRLGRGAAYAGLAAIAAATVAYGSETAFPGPAALLPTLGTAAVIAGGGVRALTLRPVQRLGRLSYAWYVWHWPVLVFAAEAWGPLSTAEGLAVAAASLVPTVLTHRLIEEPIRRAPLRAPRITLAAAPGAAAAALGAGLLLAALLPSIPTLAHADGAARLELQRTATALRPAPQHADADRGRSHVDGCLASDDATVSPPCVYGDPRSATTVVLFGDSHAMQWFPALEPIARRRGWRLVQLTKAGCPPSAARVIYAPERREHVECVPWREHVLERLERERPAIVIAAGAARYTVVGAESLEDGHAAVLERLPGRVVYLGDTPRPPFYMPDCVSEALGDLRRCAFARGAATAEARTVNAAVAEVEGVELVDPASRFCIGAQCPGVIGDVLVYRNTGHVTASYAETLAPWLERRLG
jgi:peptidoglycan/LPS O-acetylase OafA/YrhL